MQSVFFICALFASANAAVNLGPGPKFTIEIKDPSLKNGVGDLNLEGEYERELVENVNAGVSYKYNSNRGLPTSLWVSARTQLDDDSDTQLTAKAEYDVASKSTNIEATLVRGDDSITVDFDTADNTMGPIRGKKRLDLNGRRVTLEPKINVQDRTGELVINSEIEDDTTAELTVNQADESAILEVSHKLDERNTISPKVNLKTGDLSVRLNRELDDNSAVEVVASRTNVDWEFKDGSAWVVSGNLPLDDAGSSSISFKRNVEL